MDLTKFVMAEMELCTYLITPIKDSSPQSALSTLFKLSFVVINGDV